MNRVVPFALALALGAPALACTSAQLAQNARAAARQTVQQRMGTATFIYQFMYSNVKYDVQIGQPNIKGKAATVRGNLVIRATEKSSGKAVQGSYKGTVSLNKVGTCGWKVTGYKQD